MEYRIPGERSDMSLAGSRSVTSFGTVSRGLSSLGLRGWKALAHGFNGGLSGEVLLVGERAVGFGGSGGEAEPLETDEELLGIDVGGERRAEARRLEGETFLPDSPHTHASQLVTR